MKAIELTSKIELLPASMRVEVEHYIEFLLSKRKTSKAQSYQQKAQVPAKVNEPHITYAAEPDVLALAGIWEKEKKTLEAVRDKAWGKRK